ncbi:antibiotic biosynthesis monooxygenase family protein [Pseudomonas mosselii]|uniref:antibiotic biosynthesis monooxygenase family protein n=1 Tax=Pseudomonas mosselii TaxID=78327 RepID=UPI0021DB5EE1|nr:antibiotic biosynthesis monooxygenase [Pseudomonas mosselii]MCU9529882.1 antibiotic biosynthesis monooxygenase [Pseudomonas mosselii]MCU9536158.1 antibiotic biosynthesis monooxygenase [Pseudomonas mosselii]MCU9542850.1 antibiotic biosynthesis monooxygenase [Pseudomonas mosselii]MCU9548678.1 antibiotic biosynthesis monooxygenase [Pseudomonas mosselii]
MIYEIAILPIQPTHIDSFRHAFAEVAPLLSRANGHISHLLAQGIEAPYQFNLIVQWQSLEDHTPGFEASEDHQVFMAHLSPYFSEEPTVYHVQGGTFETRSTSGPADDRLNDKRLNS